MEPQHVTQPTEVLEHSELHSMQGEFVSASAELYAQLAAVDEGVSTYDAKFVRVKSLLAASSSIADIPHYRVGDDDFRGFEQTRELLLEWAHHYEDICPSALLQALGKWTNKLDQLIHVYEAYNTLG